MTDDQALDLARGHVYAFLAAALAPALASFLAGERARLGVRPSPSLAEPRSSAELPEENSCCGAMPCEAGATAQTIRL